MRQSRAPWAQGVCGKICRFPGRSVAAKPRLASPGAGRGVLHDLDSERAGFRRDYGERNPLPPLTLVPVAVAELYRPAFGHLRPVAVRAQCVRNAKGQLPPMAIIGSDDLQRYLLGRNLALDPPG